MPSLREIRWKFGRRSKVVSCILMGALILPWRIIASQGNPPLVDWNGLGVAWEDYLIKPSGENAIKVYRLLPPPGFHSQSKNDPVEKKTTDRIYGTTNIIEKKVIAKDKDAISLCFGLISISDGAFTEDLHITLGELIRVDPKLFLQELKENRKRVYFSNVDGGPGEDALDHLLLNLGPDYVDNFEAHRKEIRLRIRALKSVGNTELVAIRDECVRVFERSIQEYGPNAAIAEESYVQLSWIFRTNPKHFGPGGEVPKSKVFLVVSGNDKQEISLGTYTGVSYAEFNQVNPSAITTAVCWWDEGGDEFSVYRTTNNLLTIKHRQVEKDQKGATGPYKMLASIKIPKDSTIQVKLPILVE